MRKFHSFTYATIAVVLALGLASCDSASTFEMADSSISQDARPQQANVNHLLAAARAATARYQDETAGVAAGWEADPYCIYHGELGGMGIHYINGANMGPPQALDVRKPQALLYEPQKNGRSRLVGVEYIVPGGIVGPGGPAPMLFGEHFHFNPNVGPDGIWALHVWIWRNNPAGMFADWNPNVTCDYADVAIDVTMPPSGP
jgi:hypothetical protein